MNRLLALRADGLFFSRPKEDETAEVTVAGFFRTPIHIGSLTS